VKERIVVRPHRPGDAEPLREAVLESVDEVRPWMPWCHPGYSHVDAQEWVTSCERKFREGTEFEFVISNPAGDFLGVCGLNSINVAYRLANLGYWLRTSATGRGFATAAVRQVIEFAFHQTDLARLEIVCAVGNLRSQRVAERVGALREAVLHDRLVLHGQAHDAVLYAVLRSRWGASQGPPPSGAAPP
jgi:ribosomal-protein-serine acetyltransferase